MKTDSAKRWAALDKFLHWRRPGELRPYHGEPPIHTLWRCYRGALERARLYVRAELGGLPPKFIGWLKYHERVSRRAWKAEELEIWREFRRGKVAAAEGFTIPKPGDPDYEVRR